MNGVLYRRYTPGTAVDEVVVPVVPEEMRQQFLQQHLNAPSAGHQGSEKTFKRLQQAAYWVNMTQDVEGYCRQCEVCQENKLPAPQKASMINTPIGRPWEMIAVDILEVPISLNNNRYLLVIQDYFTKWAEAIPIPDQKAERISRELTKLFSVFGQPSIVHSDQGRNFESAILAQTQEAFGITKSRTTAYHPQGDGMVERFNRSLLQLLRTYVDKQEEWEKCLPLVLYAYRTATHASTGYSPYMLMFGRQPELPSVGSSNSFDTNSHVDYIRAKLAELCDFVETNLVEAAEHQKSAYDCYSTSRVLQPGNLVWLSVPTAGKLDPRWEGKWIVKSVKSVVNVEISDGNRTRIVHVNRLRHRLQPCLSEVKDKAHMPCTWNPSQIEHSYAPPMIRQERRYPQRVRAPPERYGY